MPIEIELLGGIHDGLNLVLYTESPVSIEIPECYGREDADAHLHPDDELPTFTYTPEKDVFGGYSRNENGAIRYRLSA